MVAIANSLPSRRVFARYALSEASLPSIMIVIVAVVAAIDCLWAALHHFDIDSSAYVRLSLLTMGLWLASLFYGRVRKSAPIAAMMFGTGFLISFSAAFSVFNNFLLTVAGTRIDLQLAFLDRTLGVDWPVMMAAMVAHPFINGVLRICYESVLPQVAVLIVCLGWREKTGEIHKFCFALALGAILTVGFWTMFPSFGAFSVYDLPQQVSARLSLSLDGHYAHELVKLLASGPGRIAPDQVKGLIGFPSFHAAMAILVVWYGRTVPHLGWPLVVLNAVVLVATPIQGGHHVVDVIAGLAVAALSVAAVKALAPSIEKPAP